MVKWYTHVLNFSSHAIKVRYFGKLENYSIFTFGTCSGNKKERCFHHHFMVKNWVKYCNRIWSFIYGNYRGCINCIFRLLQKRWWRPGKVIETLIFVKYMGDKHIKNIPCLICKINHTKGGKEKWCLEHYVHTHTYICMKYAGHTSFALNEKYVWQKP